MINGIQVAEFLRHQQRPRPPTVAEQNVREMKDDLARALEEESRWSVVDYGLLQEGNQHDVESGSHRDMEVSQTVSILLWVVVWLTEWLGGSLSGWLNGSVTGLTD